MAVGQDTYTNSETMGAILGSAGKVAGDLTELFARTVVLETAVTDNLTDIVTVSGIAADVTTVAGIDANVTTVAGIDANVTTVAGISANVTTVAGISANVTTVAANDANITTVAGINADVTTVAGIAADVTTVAGDTVPIAVVAGDTIPIGVVAGDTIPINALGLISADITGVNAIAANVTTVAGISANTTTVAGISANVTTVAGISANVTTVAANDANVTTVAGIAADVTSVAPVAANVTTVAGVSTNVTTVAGIDTEVTALAALTTEIAALYAQLATISTKANTGANNDITSMTGLSDDGIPLAKVANAASDGANSDITSMTGLTTPLTQPQGGTGGTAIGHQNLLTNSGFEVWSNSTLENVGSNMITGWSNVVYDTFTSTGANITSAIEIGSSGQAIATLSTLTIGKMYRIVVDVTLNSGQLPLFSVGTQAIFNEWVVAGTNTYVFIATATDNDLVMTNNSVANWSATFTYYEVTPGCIAADTLGPDTWLKESSTDLWREYGSANVKEDSIYALKVLSGSVGDYIIANGAIRATESYYGKFAGRTVTFGAWVKTDMASHVRLGLYDGAWTYSSYHTGGNTYEWLEVTRAISATPTQFNAQIDFDLDAKTVYISQPMLIFGSHIGEGNYSKPDNEVIYLEDALNNGTHAVIDGGLTASATIEVDTSGKIGKGVSLQTHTNSDGKLNVSILGNKNAIINGDFNIWQRGTSFAAIANAAYSADRMSTGKNSEAAITISRDTDVPTQSESGHTSNYSLKVDTTTIDASIAAGQYVFVRQIIEGYNFAPFVGRTATLSFWVKAVKTGIYCVSFISGSYDQSYVVEYTINSASTWEKKTVTLDFDYSAGTWAYTNGIGVSIFWTIACGTDYQGVADTWNSANDMATSNQVNGVDSTDNNFWLAQVQFELGSVATDFEYRQIGDELARCQRYYYRDTPGLNKYVSGFGFVANATTLFFNAPFPVEMRTAPTALEQNGTAAHYEVSHELTTTACNSVPTFNAASSLTSKISFPVASGLTAGQGAMVIVKDATAYLAWSAEL